MLWNNVLVAFDSSQAALRAVEYVGQMLGKVDGVKVTLLGIYDKVPKLDAEGTPLADKVRGSISALEHDRQRGRQNLEEARNHLLRLGLAEDRVSMVYKEKKASIVKDIIDEAQRGDHGTVVLGRRGASNVANLIFGSVTAGVINNLTGASVVVVE